MTIFNEVVELLDQVLSLGDRAKGLSVDSPLLGAVPEFDSMAVISVITLMEENYGIVVEDDDIDASAFETVGTLVRFLEQKLSG